MKDQIFKAGYRVLPQHQLIYEYRSGSPSSYKPFAEYLIARKETDDYDVSYSLIVDTSGMNFNFLIKYIEEYGKYFETKSKMSLIKRVAVFAPKPNQKAFNVDMKKTFVSMKDSKTFNDLESALDSLGKLEALEDVLNAKNDLEKNPDFQI